MTIAPSVDTHQHPILDMGARQGQEGWAGLGEACQNPAIPRSQPQKTGQATDNRWEGGVAQAQSRQVPHTAAAASRQSWHAFNSRTEAKSYLKSAVILLLANPHRFGCGPLDPGRVSGVYSCPVMGCYSSWPMIMAGRLVLVVLASLRRLLLTAPA